MATLTIVALSIAVGFLAWGGIKQAKRYGRLAAERDHLAAECAALETLVCHIAHLNEGMAGMRSVSYIAQQTEPGVAPGRSRIILSFDSANDRVAVHDSLQRIWKHWRPVENEGEPLRFGTLFDSAPTADWVAQGGN